MTRRLPGISGPGAPASGRLLARGGHLRILLPVYLISLFLFAGLLLFANLKGVHPTNLTRDPAAVLKAPVYVGVLSNLGVLFWTAAACICFFCASPGSALLAVHRKFVFCSGLLTSLLLLDDFFLLHELVLPGVLGMPENLIYAFYGTLTVLYLWRFAREIASTEWQILLLAFSWFGASVLLDLAPGRPTPTRFFAEDAAKFLGIITWLTYFWRVCLGNASPDSRTTAT